MQSFSLFFPLISCLNSVIVRGIQTLHNLKYVSYLQKTGSVKLLKGVRAEPSCLIFLPYSAEVCPKIPSLSSSVNK